MYFLYSILLSIAFICFLPYFLFQAFFHKKYLQNFWERLGILPTALQSDGRQTIWIHAVSVGETLAALPLISRIRAQFPQHRLIFTTTTATGQAVARSRISEVDGFCYYPFDWKFSVRRALSMIQPQAVVLLESELWPNFLALCQQQKIPVIVANGRVSDRSFRRSQKFAFWFRKLTKNVTRFLMQSETDAQRIIALGAAQEKVTVSGNIKYDIGNSASHADMAMITQLLATDLSLRSAPLIVAGSTTDGEEEILLAAFAAIRKQPDLTGVRLLIAPRHPERFDAVEKLLDSSHFPYVRRSAWLPQPEIVGTTGQTLTAAIPSPAKNADIILLDSIGELASIYQFATVVFVGGSLVPKGGHNILEPALAAKPIIVGPYMQNFREITNEFLRRDAVMQLQGANDNELTLALGAAFCGLLTDKQRCLTLGVNAEKTVAANRGATEKTVAVLTDLI